MRSCRVQLANQPMLSPGVLGSDPNSGSDHRSARCTTIDGVNFKCLERQALACHPGRSSPTVAPFSLEMMHLGDASTGGRLTLDACSSQRRMRARLFSCPGGRSCRTFSFLTTSSLTESASVESGVSARSGFSSGRDLTRFNSSRVRFPCRRNSDRATHRAIFWRLRSSLAKSSNFKPSGEGCARISDSSWCAGKAWGSN